MYICDSGAVQNSIGRAGSRARARLLSRQKDTMVGSDKFLRCLLYGPDCYPIYVDGEAGLAG